MLKSYVKHTTLHFILRHKEKLVIPFSRFRFKLNLVENLLRELKIRIMARRPSKHKDLEFMTKEKSLKYKWKLAKCCSANIDPVVSVIEFKFVCFGVLMILFALF